MAMPIGLAPTLIGLSARFVAVLIGVTVPGPWLARKTVFPSGVITIVAEADPTLIGLSAVLVAVRIGITVLAVRGLPVGGDRDGAGAVRDLDRRGDQHCAHGDQG